MNLTKDTYEYILNFTDDRTILNMLSVNKKFRDEALFERILKTRYPLLAKYIHYDTWTNFYIDMIYYLSKLQEEFDFPYIQSPDFIPWNLYKFFRQNPSPKTTIIIGLNISSESGDLKMIKYFLDRAEKELSTSSYRVFLEESLQSSAKNGHLDAVKYLTERKSFINKLKYKNIK